MEYIVDIERNDSYGYENSAASVDMFRFRPKYFNQRGVSSSESQSKFQ